MGTNSEMEVELLWDMLMIPHYRPFGVAEQVFCWLLGYSQPLLWQFFHETFRRSAFCCWRERERAWLQETSGVAHSQVPHAKKSSGNQTWQWTVHEIPPFKTDLSIQIAIHTGRAIDPVPFLQPLRLQTPLCHVVPRGSPQRWVPMFALKPAVLAFLLVFGSRVRTEGHGFRSKHPWLGLVGKIFTGNLRFSHDDHGAFRLIFS